MRLLLAGLLALVSFRCRDIEPLSNDQIIQGYQLNGTVTTPSGVSIDSVNVSLYYDYDLVSDTPIDTQQVVVTKSQSLVDVAVYTPAYNFVRQLYFSYRGPGPVPRMHWDERDMNNNPVPSGKYLIRYVIDTTIIKYSPVLVEGHVTAVTDLAGRFTLTNNRFPFGETFDLYDGTDAYIGTYTVLTDINLEFRKLSQISDYGSIALTNGKVTTRSFILQ